VLLVQQVLLDQLVQQVQMEPLALLDLVQLEPPALTEPPVQQVPLETMVQQDQQDHRVLQVPLEPQV
jgi:hypothetical protein